MCGLAGELRFDGTAADVATLQRMTGCLERRGPDGSGVWARGPVALTRVGPPGSLIVNSSRGGGAKDTWIMTNGDS